MYEPIVEHNRHRLTRRRNGAIVESAKGQELARKWNTELFGILEHVAPGCTKI